MIVDVAAVGVGIAGIGWLLSSIVRTLVIPRPERVWLTSNLFEGARRLTAAVADLSDDAHRRHRIRGTFAPVVLLTLPLVWSLGLVVAFAFVYYGLGVDSAVGAFELSGSSLTTLGFVVAPSTATRFVAIVEALLGLAVVALMIGFLPTFYGTFSRREVAVGRLTTRAGEPPRPADFLARLAAIGGLDTIGDLWSDWEDWFSELGETHTTFRGLIYFRSATPGRSWLSAAEAALDTAALVRATQLAPNSRGEADTMIRAGFLALRAIADLYRIEGEAEVGNLDQASIDELSIDRKDFEAVISELEAHGLHIGTDIDTAWLAFAGWRVNYDRSVTGLAALIGDVPSHWSSR